MILINKKINLNNGEEKMKKLSKVFGILMAMAIVIMSVLPVNAATPSETYDVVLTKILMPNENALANWDSKNPTHNGITYDGRKLSNIEQFFGGGAKHLKGVCFEIHKYDENKPDKIGELVQDSGEFKNSQLTDAQGQINFKGLLEGKYIIVENKSKSTIEGKKQLANSKAVPMEISLPAYNAAGNRFTTIAQNNPLYVYPKNTVDEPNIHKYVNETDQRDTALIGEEKQFRITSKMPEGIKDYKVLEIEDQLSKGLTYVGNMEINVKKKNNNTVKVNLTTDYTTDAVEKTKNAKFKITFKETFIKSLEKDDEIIVTYKAVINEDAILGAENPNEAKIIYGHNPTDRKDKESEKPELHTGGKRFIKQDADKGTIKLKDAKFIVMNKEKTKYLKQTLSANKVVKNEWVDKSAVENKTYEQIESENKVTIFSSNNNGEFEVVGLPFGEKNKKPQEAGFTEYYIKEIKAPKDYALIIEPQLFKVDYQSYYQDPTNISGLKHSDPQVINNHKVTIPQTGGIGSVVVIVGGILITALGIYMKKRNSRV